MTERRKPDGSLVNCTGEAIEQPLAPQEETIWQVWRWSGRVAQGYRIEYAGPHDKAAVRYRKIAVELRQGEVRLVNPAGEIVARQSAPALRTRW